MTEMFPPPPPHLYKYRELGTDQARARLRQLVEDATLYCAAYEDLNDPFEGQVMPLFESSRSVMLKYWAERSHLLPVAPPQTSAELMAGIIALAETRAGQERMYATMRGHLRRGGVCCLADTPSSVPMWSYYAGGHSGVCLQFRIDPAFIREVFGARGLLVKVHYSPEYPRVNFFEASEQQTMRALVGTKATDWKHEGEWRIVAQDRVGPIKYPPETLDGIIFGARASDGDREFVRGLVRDRSPRPSLFAARLKERSFALKIEPES
jgi:hypothetical protein